MRDSKVIAIIAGLTILGSATAVYFAGDEALSPPFNRKPAEATGAMLARQALSLLQPGGQVAIIVRDTSAFPNPASEVQLASFKKTLRQAHAAVGSVLKLEIDPLRPMEVPSSDFYQLIKKTPKGSVIVSFLGPPLLSPEQCQHLGEIKPGIVAFCSGSLPQHVNLKAFFEQGLLNAAVVSRRIPTPRAPGNAQEWFDHSYMAVTSANLPALAAATEIQP